MKNSFLRGAFRLGTGQVVVQLCSFLRSVILARLISPENFGIAATFAMTFSLLEMVSNLSVQTLLVQAPDGDEPSFQATGHLLIIFRGLINAVLLLAVAGPLSFIFGVPQARWAFYWLAVIPLLRGLCHLDIFRVQRHMRFTPQVAVDTITAVLVTILAWPLAAWLRDYSAMLWLLLLQAAVYNLGSHIFAETSYRLKWKRDYARRFFKFGWPLLINGLLMYGIFQGDRFVIGVSDRFFPKSVYTLTDLGIYSVAFAVTMAPSQFFVNLTTSLFLPILSRAQSAPEQFRSRYVVCTHLLSLSALAIAVPFIVAGHVIVALVYGSNYSAAGAVIPWIGAMWAMRIFRAGPTIAAMALGDTRNAMISNIVRTTALVGVVIVAATGGSLTSIAMCGFVGEVLATVVCVGRLAAKHDLSSYLVSRPFGVFAIGVVLALVTRIWAVSAVAAIGIAIALFCACAATVLVLSPELRNSLRTAMQFSQPAMEAHK